MSQTVRATLIIFLLAEIMAPAQLASGQGRPARRKSEILRRFPLTKFYDTVQPLPEGNPGDLVRSEQFGKYNLPEDVEAVRILYHSRSLAGEDVATSGVVLYPEEEQAPSGGWPIIAWAHPWTGVARDCAPSLDRNLEHGAFLAMYVRLGYAVVATDYTGLGTEFRARFADPQANAIDVMDSIPAARRALPELGQRWTAMGTGEGAAAAIRVAELEDEAADPNFLGSIALSGLADLEAIEEHLDQRSDRLPLFLAYGIETADPQFKPSDILTDKGLGLYREVDKSCELRSLAEIPAAEMLKADWNHNPRVQSYFSHSRVGFKKADRPLLVIASVIDPAIRETTRVVDRLCERGDRVDFETYSESDPASVIGDSVRDQIGWLQSRFQNKPAHSNCSPRH
jgi:Secretory lipase